SSSIADFLWRVELKSHDTSQPEGRTRVKAALREKSGAIKDSALAVEFRREFDGRFWDEFGWGKKNVQTIRKVISETRTQAKRNLRYAIDRAVLLGLTRHPSVARENYDLVSALHLQDRKLQIWR